nr:PREDICTED: uncharacterized protein LOC109032302 [Bemisia tabaci]
MVFSNAGFFHASDNRFFDEGIAYCRKQQFEKAYQCFKRHLSQNSFCQETFQMISYCQYKFTESSASNVNDLSVLSKRSKSSRRTSSTDTKAMKNLDYCQPIFNGKSRSRILKNREEKAVSSSYSLNFSKKNKKLAPLFVPKTSEKQASILLRSSLHSPVHTDSASYQGESSINGIVSDQFIKHNDSRILSLAQIMNYQMEIELFLRSLDSMLSNVEVLVNSLIAKERKQNSRLSNLLKTFHESEIYSSYLEPHVFPRNHEELAFWNHSLPHCQSVSLQSSSFENRSCDNSLTKTNIYNLENDFCRNEEKHTGSDSSRTLPKCSRISSDDGFYDFATRHQSMSMETGKFVSYESEAQVIDKECVLLDHVLNSEHNNGNEHSDESLANTTSQVIDNSYSYHHTENLNQNELPHSADCNAIRSENVLQPEVGQVIDDLKVSDCVQIKSDTSIGSSYSLCHEALVDTQPLFQSKYLSKKSVISETCFSPPWERISSFTSAKKIVAKRKFLPSENEVEENCKRMRVHRKNPIYKDRCLQDCQWRKKFKQQQVTNNLTDSAVVDTRSHCRIQRLPENIVRADGAIHLKNLYCSFRLMKNVAVQTESCDPRLHSITTIKANMSGASSTVSLFHSTSLVPAHASQRRKTLIVTNSACPANCLNIFINKVLAEIMSSVSSFPIDFSPLILSVDQAPLSDHDVKLDLIPASSELLTCSNVCLRLHGHYIEFKNLRVYQVDPFWLRYLECHTSKNIDSGHSQSQDLVSFIYPERIILHSLSTDLYNLTLLAGPFRIRFVNFKSYLSSCFDK